MSIQVGDRLPEATFTVMGKDGPEQVSSDALFKGKRVVLFAVPGAFTPTCSEQHLPGFVGLADEIKAKGNVATIACTAVNDVFVLNGPRTASPCSLTATVTSRNLWGSISIFRSSDSANARNAMPWFSMTAWCSISASKTVLPSI